MRKSKSAIGGSLAIFVDTHALVWFGVGDPRLSKTAKEVLCSRIESVLISAVTAYEFMDLNRRGRFGNDLALAEIVEHLGGEVIDYPADCSTLAALLPPVHLDPVDRMLIAHAIQLDCPVVTADHDFRSYPVRIIW